MSGGAALARVQQPRRRAVRERWDTPPKPNSHIVRYNVHAQDPLARKPCVRALYELGWHHEKGRKLDKDRRVFQCSHADLCIWLGRVLRKEANPGQSGIADEPIPRSTLTYWLELLCALHLFERYDIETGETRGPRVRGDGRHKSYWVVNSFNRALQLIFEDTGIATPLNRSFWTLDSWPVSPEVATARKLDVALAEKLPQAWANNMRSHSPYAPFKPARRTVRPPTAEEIEIVHRVLTGKPWEIGATKEQAAEIIAWARGVEGAERVPAEWLAEAIDYKLRSNTEREHRKYPYRAPPENSVKLFGYETMRGMGEVWKRQQEQAAKQGAQDAVTVNPEAIHDGTDPDPPPDIPIPRKPFP